MSGAAARTGGSKEKRKIEYIIAVVSICIQKRRYILQLSTQNNCI